MSVVSCRFRNSITQLAADLLAVSLTNSQQVGNKLAASPSTGNYVETGVMDFGHNATFIGLQVCRTIAGCIFFGYT